MILKKCFYVLIRNIDKSSRFDTDEAYNGRAELRRGSNHELESSKIQAYFASNRRASSTSSLVHPSSPSESNISSYFDDPTSNVTYILLKIFFLTLY
jgi:hypothetical protein